MAAQEREDKAPSSDERVPALRPYLEEIERICAETAPDRLCELIVTLAKEKPPRERLTFLERLRALSTSAGRREEELNPDEEIIDRILALRADIAERQEAIENGTFEEEYEDDYQSYDRYDGLHRGSYGRAAEVLVALVEAHHLTGYPAKARALLDLYRDEKYRRHRAFRKEVDLVLARSALFRHLVRSR